MSEYTITSNNEKVTSVVGDLYDALRSAENTRQMGYENVSISLGETNINYSRNE